MAIPKAEQNRLNRASDGTILASILDDCRNYAVDDPTRKKQLICFSLVLYEVLIWETFVEDIVTEGQEFLLANLDDPTKLGFAVLLPVTDDLFNRKDKRSIWGIAGTAWRDRVREHRIKLLDGFHTPRPVNVDALIHETLGIKDISLHWHWQNTTNAQAKKRLNGLVTMRGAIAHNLLNVPSLNFKHFLTRLMLSRKVSRVTSNRIRLHIHQLTGKYPWDTLW